MLNVLIHAFIKKLTIIAYNVRYRLGLAAEKREVPPACLSSYWDVTTRDGGSMEREEWRDIDGYENVYQVSSEGRIRSLDRFVPNGTGKRLIRGQIIKTYNNPKTGYLFVKLCINRHHRNYDVHRIVAKTFIDNPDNLPCVDHINFNKHDNSVKNLRWVTQKENINSAIRAGRIDLDKKREILNNPEVKKRAFESTAKGVTRSDGVVFSSTSEAARKTGCSTRAVTLNLRGINKTCKGYTFKYTNDCVGALTC